MSDFLIVRVNKQPISSSAWRYLFPSLGRYSAGTCAISLASRGSREVVQNKERRIPDNVVAIERMTVKELKSSGSM